MSPWRTIADQNLIQSQRLSVNGWRIELPAPAAPNMALITSIMRLQQVFLSPSRAPRCALFGLTFARYEVLMLLSGLEFKDPCHSGRLASDFKSTRQASPMRSNG